MKHLLVVLVLTLSTATFAHAQSGKVDPLGLPKDIIYGAPPDKTVKNWIRLNILGASTAPWLIFWFSPQKFEREGANWLIVLSPDKYRGLRTFVRANRCSIVEPKIPAWRTLQTTEYSGGRNSVLCIMSRTKACSYLSKMVSLPALIPTEQNEKPISFLQSLRKAECKDDIYHE